MAEKQSNEPWKTDNWFSSPWNFEDDIRADFKMPENLRVHDVTLRDGEQQAGVVFTTEDKIAIAEKLSEAGVHRIEAGLPAVSPADEAAVRGIVQRELPAEIWAFSRCVMSDVKLAAECGVTGVVMEIPSSHHLIEEAYQWPVEKAIDLSIEATSYARELGLKVSYFPIDATRAGITQYLDLVSTVAEKGHVDSCGLVDTFGVLSPHAVSFFVRRTREKLDVPLETHFHMDFGMGVANTAMAVAEGAEIVQTTVTGLGERAGNTPMEETLMALLTMYGVDTGVDTSRFYDISQEVLERAGVQQPSNRPVVGKQLFEVESGIIASWVKNVGDAKLTEAFPYRPEVVGQGPPKIVLGKGSGVDSINVWLDKHGMSADTEMMTEILMEVKARSLDLKRLLTDDEFLKIVDGYEVEKK